jgi:hypothetical protein
MDVQSWCCIGSVRGGARFSVSFLNASDFLRIRKGYFVQKPSHRRRVRASIQESSGYRTVLEETWERLLGQ